MSKAIITILTAITLIAPMTFAAAPSVPISSGPASTTLALFAWARLLPAAMAAAPKLPDPPSEMDFSEKVDLQSIPGVTSEDIKALDDLRARLNRPLLAGSPVSTEAFLSDEGVRGFYRHFCDWLSMQLEIPFEPVIYEWDELVAKLYDGTLDFTCELTSSPERLDSYHMSEPIAERSIVMYRLEGARDLTTIEDKRRVVFGFLSGTNTMELVAPLSRWLFTAVKVKDYDEAFGLLKSGSIDAFLEENTAEAAFEELPEVMVRPFYPIIFTEVSMATTRDDLNPVIEILSKAIKAGAIKRLVELYNQGEHEYRGHRFRKNLTDEERAFIDERSREGKPVLIGAENENYPICFFNETEGVFQGSALEVLNEISLISGLVFQIAHEDPVDWIEMLGMLESGQLSLITELIPSKDRLGRFIWPESYYQSDNFALLSRQETPDKKPNELLYANVGLIESTAYAELFERWFPSHPSVKRYLTINDGFNALEAGEIELLMGTSNIILAMTNYQEKPGFKVNHTFDYSFDSTFGLNKNEAVLASILNKALPMVDTERIVSSWQRRTFDYRAEVAKARVPWLIGLSLMMGAMLVMASVILRRRKEEKKNLESVVRERTKELEAQTEAAQEASRAKGDFLARMSHEIRTPMNAIIGMAELALRERVSDEALEMIGNISQAGNSLLAIINDILDFSKIESGKMELSESEYHFSSLVHDAISVIGTRLSDSPLDFLVEIDSRLPGVMTGDEVRLRQILLNLLTNACKYTEKGYVRLRIEGSLGHGEVSLRLAVKDSGKGIKPENLCKLFGDFTQFDQVANRGIEGTGLGLAISRNLARLMGGDIFVESVFGQGSEFVATVTQRYKPDCSPLAKLKKPDNASIILCEPRTLFLRSLWWTLDRLGVHKMIHASAETLDEILSQGGWRYVIAPDSESPKVMSAIKKAPGPVQAILTFPPTSRARMPSGAIGLAGPIYCIPLANILNDGKPAAAKGKRSGKASFTAPGVRALVVDDLEINLKVVKGLLMPFKLQVDLAASGQEALDKVSENLYDLIFMDHMMPGMDGLEATRRIRDLPNGKFAPIIALTANAVTGIKEMFLAEGMNDFISKPIEVRKLEEALVKWIPKSKIEKAPIEPDPAATQVAFVPESLEPAASALSPPAPQSAEAKTFKPNALETAASSTTSLSSQSTEAEASKTKIS